jgi:hypothetical protein
LRGNTCRAGYSTGRERCQRQRDTDDQGGEERGLFLRIVDSVETTGTLRPRTGRYRAEGFDPRSLADALYLRDDHARAYLPLTAETYDAIQNCRRRV